MSENAEKNQEILQLLADGKIDVDEAAAMLTAAKQSEQDFEVDPLTQPITQKEPDSTPDVEELIKVEPDPALKYTADSGSSPPSWLRVRVSDLKTGKKRVSVNVPMRLVRFGFAMGRRFAPELDELDWDEIDGFLSAEQGMLVDVRDEEDGEHVQIFVD